MDKPFITVDERAEWDEAFRLMVRSTVATHLLGRLQPVLAPMFETLDRIEDNVRQIRRLA